ncbi:right-handed parallel beta-helix repeat-containing protein [Flavobacterium lindanitolerans]|jgi:hypothetical protein|uniref:right-handed parallel beta-helix repeat-containing protein n=1 Tax=Flavobacterium lindanitolerans TaxID=428988 RepID=UPI0023F16A47|nr:right-handed parallel beta-helix repeat-containing protein [Flavobacterium lindanitolerans]
MKQKILFTLFISFSYIFVYSQTNIYASPNGPNTNDGLSVGTAVNLQKAKDIARNIISNGPLTGDVIINILPGEHILNQTLVFDSTDSGNNGHYIIYKSYSSESPVISGGQKITGWSIYDRDKNIWKASIGNLYSRQLYVNGIKAVRARSNDNFNIYETKTGYFSTCNDFSNWGNIQDLEIVSCMHWRNHRIPVTSICGNQIVINQTFWNSIHAQKTFESAPVKWIENAYNLIDEEQEWYIDKTSQTLYYKPSNSITSLDAINALNIIMPKLEKLIMIEGSRQAMVTDIKFLNLGFSYTTWNKPSEYDPIANANFGFTTHQADATYPVQIPGAVSVKYGKNIHFKNNNLRHIGSTGLAVLIGSNNNIICSNSFEDISGSGIYLGDFANFSDPCLNPLMINDDPFYDPTNVNGCRYPNGINSHDHLMVINNKITNNFLNNIANEYFSSTGICVTYAKNTLVSHNTISNFPYSGISFGWGWDNKVDHGTNNEISYNKINCSKQFMGDAGGIYTLSSLGSPTSKAKINNNYILNQTSYLGAIYLDQGSSNIEIFNNLIDIENGVIIPDAINCIPNSNGNLRALMCYYNSKDVNFYNNFYNNRYNSPLNPNNCEGFGCQNVVYTNNQTFSGYSSHSQGTIITNSGQQTNYICN